MAEIHHEIKVRATAERIREALMSATELQAWHGGRVTVAGNALRFEYADGSPSFCWAIQPDKSGKGIVWRCLEGPGDSVGTEASFAISAGDKGRSLVEFVHRGWPHTSGNFRKCNTQWAILLHHLCRYLETGKADPALRAPM